MRSWVLLAFMAVFPLSGRGQSIQPFYSTKDIEFKPELLGKWDIEGVTLEFCDAGEKAYGINLPVDNGTVIHFRAHLFRLAGRYFLDGQISAFETPDGNVEEGKKKEPTRNDGPNKSFSLDEQDILLNRHHGLILIEFTKDVDEFIGHVWKESWLPEMAEKKKLNCPYVQDELHRTLLTGDTPQLRAFVGRLPVEAFDSGVTLTRIKEEPKKAVAPKSSEK